MSVGPFRAFLLDIVRHCSLSEVNGFLAGILGSN